MHRILLIFFTCVLLLNTLFVQSQVNLPPNQIQLLDSLNERLKSLEDSVEMANIYSIKGDLFGYVFVDSSVYYHGLAMRIFINRGLENLVIEEKIASVEQLYIRGELWRSIQYAYDAEEYFIAQGDSIRLPSLYNSMGNNLKRQKDWRGAMKYYKINQTLAPKMGQLRYLAFSHMNMGRCYFNLGILDSSLMSGEKAIEVMEKIGLNHQGYLYSANGLTLYEMNRKEEGFKNMIYGINLGKKERGIERLTTTQLNYLANCYLNESELDSAIKYAGEAYQLSSIMSVLLEQETSAQILASAYEKKGAVDSALHYLKNLMYLKEKVEESAKIIHARELKAESIAKEEEVKHLVELNKKDRTRNILIGSALLFFLMILALYTRVKYIRKINYKLESAKNRAERSEAFKQQFLANMSHEIRTPMNAILGMTNLTLDTSLSEKQRTYLSAVKKSTENLLVIINDILDLSKLEAGKMDLELIPFNLADQLSIVHNTLRFKAEEKGLEFSVHLDESIPTYLKGDPFRLTQVLINLCGNAIKFTEKGMVQVRVSIPENTDLVMFSVIDTGIGIPQEKVEKLFTAFQQADEGVSRKYGGTGLGLSISKTLVELQNGEIGLKSEEGKGSEFFFTLPFNVANEKDIEALLEEKKIDVSGLKGIKILLAEDNKFNQIVLHDTIKHLIEDSSVEIAENGKIAVEKLKEKEYDVVLMDVNMPEMTGYEATEYIRKNLDLPKKNITILALTASILSDDIKRFESSGMNGYIPKPFTREELILALNKHYRYQEGTSEST